MKSLHFGRTTDSPTIHRRHRLLRHLRRGQAFFYFRLGCLVVVSALVIVSAKVEVAAAFPSSWSRTSSPNHAGGVNQLNGVSCPSENVCVAVGAWFPSGFPRTLIESSKGSKWSIVPSPAPGSESYLSAVSCVSVDDCVAVGY